jgi:hypothetical protein
MKAVGLALALALIASSSAFAQKVQADWDHNADFSHYRTFAYVKSQPVENPLMDQRIVEAIKAELTAKGLTENSANPAMVVTYTAAMKQDKEYVANGFGGGYGMGWRWGGGMGSATVNSFTTVQGTIVVDMYDAANKQMLFRGSATDTVSDKPEKDAQKIQKGMKKLFEKFPPKE